MLYKLESVCCKKLQKILPDQLIVWGEPPKDLKDSKLSLNKTKLFPWSSRISLVQFRTFRGPLFSKPVTGQELFLAVSYSKLALIYTVLFAQCVKFLWITALIKGFYILIRKLVRVTDNYSITPCLVWTHWVEIYSIGTYQLLVDQTIIIKRCKPC